MNAQSKALLAKIAEKKANDKAEFGLMLADIAKANTVAQIKVVLIKALTQLSK